MTSKRSGGRIARFPDGEPVNPKPPRLPPQAQARRFPMIDLARKALGVTGYMDNLPDTPGAHGQHDDGTGSTLPLVAASRVIPDAPPEFTMLQQAGTVEPPPYDPRLLVAAYEESDALAPCVAAMAQGISGYGMELLPTFPKQDERGQQLEAPAGADAQRADALLFLASVAPRGGLRELHQAVDTDAEVIGYGFVEVLRDLDGDPAGLEHAPAYTVRLGRLSDPVLSTVRVLHPVTQEVVTMQRYVRWRQYVQVRGSTIRYFKEYGDPRPMNRITGEYRAPEGEPFGADPKSGAALDATELFMVRIYSPRTDYGVPRWIGALPHVRAGRSAAELLVRWFDGAPIGTKLLLSSGGAVDRDQLDAMLDHVDAVARGEENAFSVVAVEARGASGPVDPLDGTKDQRPALELVDLAFSPDQSLFMGDGNMIDGSRKRTRAQFRLGPVHTGESEDYSHAAVRSATAHAEDAVFRPIRSTRWDPLYARLFLDRGITLWKATPRGAATADDNETAKALTGIVQGGGASPNQLIRLLNRITGQEQPVITEAWGDRPLSLTQTLLGMKLDPNLPLGEALEAAQERADAMAEAIASGQGPGTQDGPPRPPGAQQDEDEDEDAEVQRRMLGVAVELITAAAEADGGGPEAVSKAVQAVLKARGRDAAMQQAWSAQRAAERTLEIREALEGALGSRPGA